MTTRTGYSCEYLRKKLKHGCRMTFMHYCNHGGLRSEVFPATCHVGCKMFTGSQLDAIMQQIPRRQPTLADELL